MDSQQVSPLKVGGSYLSHFFLTKNTSSFCFAHFFWTKNNSFFDRLMNPGSTLGGRQPD